MDSYLGRKVFHAEDVGFFEEMFCLADGREIRFYQIVRGRSVYQLDWQVGRCLEEVIAKITKTSEDADPLIESALIGYTIELKSEFRH